MQVRPQSSNLDLTGIDILGFYGVVFILFSIIAVTAIVGIWIYFQDKKEKKKHRKK